MQALELFKVKIKSWENISYESWIQALEQVQNNPSQIISKPSLLVIKRSNASHISYDDLVQKKLH